MSDAERAQALVDMNPRERRNFLARFSSAECKLLEAHWPHWARSEQLPPPLDWRVWLICAGRGFGKTRAGAEWVRTIAAEDPEARIALVAQSIGEARAVMVEGESGLLACHADDEVPHFEPSLRRLKWPNGAQAILYSAAEPESLRGPQHSHAWCDEIAKWDNASGRAVTAWDNLQLGLRLGERPRIVATTTPRAVPLMRRLADPAAGGVDPDVAITRGRMQDNFAHLPAEFLRAMRQQYGRSALGRQELDGELLVDVDGALWTRSLLERCRGDGLPVEKLARIVVAVDPPASAHGDACGIVVAAKLTSGLAGGLAGGSGDAAGPPCYAVLGDFSVEKPSPERWARKVAQVFAMFGAGLVVAEANQGGAMVRSVLRGADIALPVKLVHARQGKSARAEPVAVLYEAGRVTHAGSFAALEDELCGMMTGGGYEGPGRSPDRADALVYALTELMERGKGRPRVSLP